MYAVVIHNNFVELVEAKFLFANSISIQLEWLALM